MTIENRRRRARRVYLSIAAQPDNLGDIAIRQAAIDIVAGERRKLVVFVGSMPADYVDAFDYPEDAELVVRSRTFVVRYLSDAARARADLIFAPGPLQLRRGIKAAAKAAANLMNIVAARATGGRVIALGRALRGTGEPAFTVERFAIRWYSLFVARDSASAQVVRRNLDQAPDLAFLRQPRRGIDVRGSVAISLRGDRSVNVELIADVVQRARALDLVPVFVTQVARDDDQHRELAERFDAEVVSWSGVRHREQLVRVEETYARCRFVVSDRLHALILGSVGGAVPIALLHSGSDKLPSTLSGVLSAHYVDTAASSLGDISLANPDATRLSAELSQARASLAALAARVSTMLG